MERESSVLLCHILSSQAAKFLPVVVANGKHSSPKDFIRLECSRGYSCYLEVVIVDLSSLMVS